MPSLRTAALAALFVLALGAAAHAQDRDQKEPAASDRDRSSAEHEAEEAREAAEAKHAGLRSDTDRELYALGALLGRRPGISLKGRELELVLRGFREAMSGQKLAIEGEALEELGPKVDALVAKRQNPQLAHVRETGQAFVRKEGLKRGAVHLRSGSVLVAESPGSGEAPAANDLVQLQFKAMLPDGTVWGESSPQDKAFPLDQVVPCLREAIPRMRVGGRARLACPASAAYGDKGMPPKVPAGSAVVYELTLQGVVHPTPSR